MGESMKQKSFERKEEVIIAALDEFTIKKYEQASLNKIIKNSKISKGTFYYHFENKEALYLYLLKEGVDLKWTYISENMVNKESDFSQLDIFDKFLYQAKQGILFGKEYPKYSLLGKMFTKESGEPIYDIVLTHLSQDSHDILKPMIEEAIKNGELNTKFEVSFIVKTLTYLFNSFEDIIGTSSDSSIAIEELSHFIEFMKYGFKSE